MKKLLTVLLVFVSLSLTAQVNIQPPKIILQIDSVVNQINKHKTEPYTFKHPGNYSHDTITICVWLIDNRIYMIKKTITVYDFSKNKPPLIPIITEYYFSNNNPILIRKDENYNGVVYMHQKGDKSNQDSTVFTNYYFDNYEIMSERKVRITDTDTIMVFNEVLKDAVDLFEKYKTLQNYNPFKNLKYDKVVAYDFDGTGDGRSRIIENGKLHPSTKKSQHKTLNVKQVDSLLNFLSDTNTFGGNHAFCFEPRLGIVFYNGKKIVADINICFACNSLESSIYLPAEVHHKLIYDGDDYLNVLPQTGFSPDGRRQLKQLCHNLGLGLCGPIHDGTIFDGVTDEEEE